MTVMIYRFLNIMFLYTCTGAYIYRCIHASMCVYICKSWSHFPLILLVFGATLVIKNRRWSGVDCISDVWLAANCLCDKDTTLYAIQNRHFLLFICAINKWNLYPLKHMGQRILHTLHVNIKALENTILEITFKLCCFDLLCSRNAITVKIPQNKISV